MEFLSIIIIKEPNKGFRLVIGFRVLKVFYLLYNLVNSLNNGM